MNIDIQWSGFHILGCPKTKTKYLVIHLRVKPKPNQFAQLIQYKKGMPISLRGFGNEDAHASYCNTASLPEPDLERTWERHGFFFQT